MDRLMMFAKGLTLTSAAIIAGVALVLALFVVRQGLLNSLLWLVGIGALVIAGINKVSYG